MATIPRVEPLLPSETVDSGADIAKVEKVEVTEALPEPPPGTPLSSALPPELAQLFTANPDGMARNILDASLNARTPKDAKTLEALDKWAREALPTLKTSSPDAFRSSINWLGLAQQDRLNSIRPSRATLTREAEFTVEVDFQGHYYRRETVRYDVSSLWSVDIPLSVASEGDDAIWDHIRDQFYENYYEMEEVGRETIDSGESHEPECSSYDLNDLDLSDIMQWAEDME